MCLDRFAPHHEELNIAHPKHHLEETCSRGPSNVPMSYFYVRTVCSPKTSILFIVKISAITGSRSLQDLDRSPRVLSREGRVPLPRRDEERGSRNLRYGV